MSFLNNLVKAFVPQSTDNILVIQDRQFRVKERLGEGGFAFVHRVVEQSTEEAFALKMMYIQTSEQEQAVKHEVAIHTEIRHPNVLPLLGFSMKPSKKRPKTSEGFLLFPLCKVSKKEMNSYEKKTSCIIPFISLLTPLPI
jgi:serine/threonine protein kinase